MFYLLGTEPHKAIQLSSIFGLLSFQYLRLGVAWDLSQLYEAAL